MNDMLLTRRQASTFILLWQGLLGPKRFAGAAGVLAYVRQAGCLQYDPVDICGKNAELVLFARVSGFRKAQLDKLLYKQRLLADHWDKNMSLFCVEDWPCFARNRRAFRGWQYTEESRLMVQQAAEQVLETARKKGVICSQQLDMREKIDWPWAPAALGRAVLEYLYFTGALCIHHRRGTQRYYAPAASCLSPNLLSTADPHPEDSDYYAWHTLRRVAAVGLLWNQASDAFLAIPGYGAQHRQAAFERLTQREDLLACRVEGLKQPLYYPKAAQAAMEMAVQGVSPSSRLEFIAPLDSLLWDRKLIKALFAFDYRWEIYTPADRRKYGAYTLPVLYGNRFAGRIDLACSREQKTLLAKQFWPEADFRLTKSFAKRLHSHMARFARFNGCTQVVVQAGFGVPAP